MKEFIFKIKNTIVTKTVIIWDKTKFVGLAFQREAHETEVASKILMKIIKGKEVTHEEIQFLKDQSVDLGKALTIIGLQAVPGSNIAIIAIEKFGQKHGFTLFPKAQIEPNNGIKDISKLK
jgi:hypothetical protein